MESVIEQVGETLADDVLTEAVDELVGRSKRKWAVMLLAFVIGGVVVALAIRYRQRSTGEDGTVNDNTIASTSQVEEQG
jgi:hypothetical protein